MELKHHKLVRSIRSGTVSRDLKPNAKTRDQLNVSAIEGNRAKTYLSAASGVTNSVAFSSSESVASLNPTSVQIKHKICSAAELLAAGTMDKSKFQTL